MAKSIQLKLSKIKYKGDSLGDDIRVEIEVLGKFLHIDKKIKAANIVGINQEVGRFKTDRGYLLASVSITVIEKDLLFNDVGSTEDNIKINTAFVSGVKHGQMAKATYSISTKLFTVNGKKYRTIDDPDIPWAKGLYDIEIPDYPHGRNDLYSEAKRQKVWFRIGHSGARYLHVGSRTLGCMTIIETVRWMEIYNALIKARKGDFMSIGEVEITD